MDGTVQVTRHFTPRATTGLLFTSDAHYAVTMAQMDLRPYFTQREISRYFGARNANELRQVLDLVRAMTPVQLGAFKRELKKLASEMTR